MIIAVVVLAGGEGTRMGGDKPLRMVGGKRLIDRAAEAAQSRSRVVAVAVRASGQLGDIGLREIIDDPSIDGPLGGLASGLRFAGESGCRLLLTIPSDMPFLPSDLAPRLTAAIGDAGVAVAGSGGALHPVCALWTVSALDWLPDYLATRKRSLRGFAEAARMRVVEWPTEHFDPFFNINSPADLATAEQLLTR